jgi:hypothetical protein
MRPLRKMAPVILSLVVCALAAANTVASTVEEAKAEHKLAVVEAKEAMGAGIDTHIKEAASDGDLETIKELIAAKEAFQKSGVIPTHAKLTEDAVRYIGHRKLAASKLYAAYKADIKSYTKSLDIDRATALEREMKAFVETERKAILLSRESTDSKGLESPSAKTKDLFETFYEQYLAVLDKIAEQSTTAKREEVHRELTKRLNDKIKSQLWEFNCVIRNVRESDGTFEIFFYAPEETPGFRDPWETRSSISNLRLSKSQGLNLGPGDVLVVKGNPRFVVGSFREQDSAFFHRDCQVGDIYARHYLQIVNPKISFAKSKESTPEVTEFPSSE